MPAGRPPGTTGTPTHRRAAARLEADFPEYHPLVVMAEGAIELALAARSNPDLWVEAVTASDKVAAYIIPKLKAVEHTGAGGSNLLVQLVSSDADL